MIDDTNPTRECGSRERPRAGSRVHLRAHAALALLCAALPAAAPRAETLASPAQQSNKFHITAQEKAACSSDAIRFCMYTYPDEDQLLACMKQNRDALSSSCRVAFDAGVKRRRL